MNPIVVEGGADFTDIAWLASGGYAVAWMEYGLNRTIKVQIFNPDGTPRIAPATLVAGDNQINVDELVALPTGGLMAIITGTSGNYGQVIGEDGSLLGGPFPAVIGNNTEMAILNDLTHVVVAENFDADGTGIFTRTMEPNSVIINSYEQVNTQTSLSQIRPKIAPLETGGYVVTWLDNEPSPYRSVKAQVYNALGQKFGGEIAVSSPVLPGADPDDGIGGVPEIAPLSGGGFVVTWMFRDLVLVDASGPVFDTGIHFKIFNAAGQAVTEVIGAASGRVPKVVGFEETFALTWIDSSPAGATIIAQLYASNGAAIAGPFAVSPLISGNNLTGGLQEYSVTGSGTGELAVNWITSELNAESVWINKSYANVVSVADLVSEAPTIFLDFGSPVEGQKTFQIGDNAYILPTDSESPLLSLDTDTIEAIRVETANIFLRSGFEISFETSTPSASEYVTVRFSSELPNDWVTIVGGLINGRGFTGEGELDLYNKDGNGGLARVWLEDPDNSQEFAKSILPGIIAHEVAHTYGTLHINAPDGSGSVMDYDEVNAQNSLEFWNQPEFFLQSNFMPDPTITHNPRFYLSKYVFDGAPEIIGLTGGTYDNGINLPKLRIQLSLDEVADYFSDLVNDVSSFINGLSIYLGTGDNEIGEDEAIFLSHLSPLNPDNPDFDTSFDHLGSNVAFVIAPTGGLDSDDEFYVFDWSTGSVFAPTREDFSTGQYSIDLVEYSAGGPTGNTISDVSVSIENAGENMMDWRSTTFFFLEDELYQDGDLVVNQDQMLENFVGFLDAWADYGLNSVSLTWFVPVDPITGDILQEYGPDVPAYLRGLPSDERLALFTDAAHQRGFDVSWKTNFIPNQAGEGNINEVFAPSINVANFLSEVEEYWTALAPKAEASNVEMVIIGGEQGGYAGPDWDTEWRGIIDAVRSGYTGQVTYDALGYVGHPTVAADDITFWDELDYIGISMYLPLANDDTPTLSEAQYLLRNNQSFEGQTPVDVPAVLEALSETFGKQILFTEIGGNSSVGSLANPPASFSETSFFEQSILYATHLDEFSKYEWVAGMNWWNNVAELSNPPDSEFWDFWYTITEKQFPFMGKPSGDVVRAFWGDGNNGSPISGEIVLGDENPNNLVGTALGDILIGSLENDTLNGLGGDDRVMGGDGSDLISGDDGSDVIYGGSSHRDLGDQLSGGAGDDHIYGGFGNDTLNGNDGTDTLNGGEGSDTLRGQGDTDTLSGGTGNDRLEGGTDSDWLDGGDDNDELFGGGSGDDTLIGGRGSDFLFGENGNDWLDGGDGFDLLNGGTDADTMLGGNGNDRLFGNLGFDSLEGGAGNDTLYGGPSGNDTLIGGTGKDEMYGEAGADILQGGDGMDTLRGGSGNDQLFGGNDDDLIEGGSGNDQLYGGPTGEDTLKGGQGSDFLYAESANDTMEGGDGFDLMNGGAGDDSMSGGNGNDRLEGNLGEDTLDGGAGDDELYGGNGGSSDTLIGGTGNDTLVGEAGADTFIFADGFGIDVINDFDEFSSAETINLAAVTSITDFADLSTNHMSQSGSDALIDDLAGNTITVLNALVTDLGVDDFSFVV